MNVDDFDYELPPELIAQRPIEPRDAARLLCWNEEADAHGHQHVRDLPELLEPGDLVVFNDTRVRPARLFARRASGGQVELVFLEPEGEGRWRALARPARKLKVGDRLQVAEGGPQVSLVGRAQPAEGPPLWSVECEDSIEELLERYGRMPLPPYVRRERGEDPEDERDRERYQTVYARETGAVAAPTAGLHFTPELLQGLEQRGVACAFVTLHVGMGTFRPVTAEDTAGHVMHHERYRLGQATVDAIHACRERGGRVVAVGTTCVRVLESCAGEDGSLEPTSGSTNLFILPGHRFRVVQGLLTNFHLPRSTLVMLVSALAGRERILALYREAIERRYRFFSYGDAMLLLPSRR